MQSVEAIERVINNKKHYAVKEGERERKESYAELSIERPRS